MNLDEAFQKEIDRGRKILYAAEDEICHVCGQKDECRAGACFDCKDKVETDMIEVWEIEKPGNRWPYQWAGKPTDVSEEDLRQIQEMVDPEKS